jgi:hypothetical protein
MAGNKNVRSALDLPTKIKNKLRGYRSTIAAVDELRATVSPKHYLPLIKRLHLYPFRGVPLLPQVGVRVERFRVDLPTLGQIPIEREFLWAAFVFCAYAEQLNQYLVLKTKFEIELLLGRHDDSQATLSEVEAIFGFSICALELRVAALQIGYGLESQKNYSGGIRGKRRKGDLISFLSHFTSWRNEDTTNPFQFKKTISEAAADWEVEDDFRAYILFKLTGDCVIEEATLSSVLRHEATFSLIDYYETFIRLAIQVMSRGNPGLKRALAAPLVEMADKIADGRLSKLAFLSDLGSPENLKHCVVRSLEADDALLRADYTRFGEVVGDALSHWPNDTRLWLNAAIAQCESSYALVADRGLGSRMAGLLRTVLEKSGEYDESVFEGARLVLNCGLLPSVLQFEAFFWPQLSSEPHPDGSTQLVGFFASNFLEPSALRLVPPNKRPGYADVLGRSYVASNVVRFEVWRSGEGGASDTSFEMVSPWLLDEVQIEHLDAAGRSEEALERSQELEAGGSLRYKRIAQRWIAACLFALGRPEDAIDYVCRVCISDWGALPMMPVPKCASILDKKLRKRLAGKLSTPIVLDIYDREVGSEYESQRNYAYEDFLTAHGLQKPSQLKGRTGEFGHDLIVYYLERVCVQEVMQASTAFSSSSELDEERLAVCALLAEIDPANLDVHESEVQELTRKIVIRRAVREVEQSKIYVDMLAIRRWADKSLRESFSRYQALLGAGLDAGTAGITDAIRDMLTGGKVSEENFRLPKNEMSDLLVSMVSAFFDQCLQDPAHGLDSYLSMRVRHGALAGQLRAPLEQEHVISQREGLSDEYKRLDHWMGIYDAFPSDVLGALDARLRTFSRDFDALIEQFANEYLQIRTKNKPEGLFQAAPTTLIVGALASEISAKVTLDEFISGCSDIFWSLLDKCLHSVRTAIDVTLKPDVDNLFRILQADVRKIQQRYTVAELDSAVVNAQTKTQQAIEQVKDWFRVPQPLVERDLEFEEIVAIGLDCVKKLHPDFRPGLSVEVPAERFRVVHLNWFSDIFFLIFDNIRKHSGLDAPVVTVRGEVVGSTLVIEIRNTVAVITATGRESVTRILREIEEGRGQYLPGVRSEGGTGLKKLWNILRPEPTAPRLLEFGFTDNEFVVRFDVKVFEMSKQEPAGVAND